MEKVLELTNKYKTLLGKYKVNTPLRLAHFGAQIEHESNLKPISENLNYSAQALMSTFRTHFIDLEEAKLFERQLEKIAKRVYSNRRGKCNASTVGKTTV